MNIITIILTGFALAMDAFAVSVTKGMTLKNLTKKMAIKIALFFGVFQAAMPSRLYTSNRSLDCFNFTFYFRWKNDL